tara:strand:- start:1024 stop:1527 length:504 start_codon:yes stop_codon:yes gene_type:complete
MPTKRNTRRVAKAVSKGKVEKAARIAGRPARRAERITKRGGKKVERLQGKIDKLTTKVEGTKAKTVAKVEKVNPKPAAPKPTPVKPKPTPVKPKKVEQTFGQAFKQARKTLGAGKTFTYKGKKYTTNTAEDLKKGREVRGNAAGPKKPNPNRKPTQVPFKKLRFGRR